MTFCYRHGDTAPWLQCWEIPVQDSSQMLHDFAQPIVRQRFDVMIVAPGH